MSIGEIREVLGTIRALCTVESLTIEDHDRAIGLMERYKFSLYDSLIAAAALRVGCKTLYAEDLQHRQVIDKQLTVVNPFG